MLIKHTYENIRVVPVTDRLALTNASRTHVPPIHFIIVFLFIDLFIYFVYVQIE